MKSNAAEETLEVLRSHKATHFKWEAGHRTIKAVDHLGAEFLTFHQYQGITLADGTLLGTPLGLLREIYHLAVKSLYAEEYLFDVAERLLAHRLSAGNEHFNLVRDVYHHAEELLALRAMH